MGASLTWSSNSYAQDFGWKLCFAETTPVWILDDGPCNVNGDCLTSPNFPDNYDNDQYCLAHVEGGSSNAFTTTFSTEKKFDILMINGEEYSGDLTLDVVIPEIAPVIWSSDIIVPDQGFELCLGDRSMSPTTAAGGSWSDSPIQV